MRVSVKLSIWETLANGLLRTSADVVLRTLGSESALTEVNLILTFLWEFTILFSLKLSPRIQSPTFRYLQMQMVIYLLPSAFFRS